MSATDIAAITQALKGKTITVQGHIENVIQTSGPTLFFITDGTGAFTIKAFERGARAFPTINAGDYITAMIQVSERDGALEGEVRSMSKLTGSMLDGIKDAMKAVQRQRAQPHRKEFVAKDALLEKMKPAFIEAATQIRLAVFSNRPILVRHHNDCDGYSAAIALERAILPLIQQQHSADKAQWQYYERAPCAAPFYDIEDAIKDVSRALSDKAKFSEKMPLVIIVDNGSTEQDLLSIQQCKLYGFDFIVVDHHAFGPTDVITPQVLAHVNPFIFGGDQNYSAGMLCFELAHLLGPTKNSEHIAALAGLADRVENPAMETYLGLAAQKGYTKEYLVQVAKVIDYAASKFRFNEAREYVDVLFGSDKELERKTVELFIPEIARLEEQALAVGKSVVVQEKIGDVLLNLLDVEMAFSRSVYPKAGKSVGILHDAIKADNPNCVTVGVMSDGFTIRATEGSRFSVHKFIEHLQSVIPLAFAEGGGHAHAGSIRFVPIRKEQAISELKAFIKNA